MHDYIPLYRPAGFATLPSGISWEYVEAPKMPGLVNRPDLKTSQHYFGVIRTDRPLTADELKAYELRAA
jgi:hypothetical protein